MTKQQPSALFQTHTPCCLFFGVQLHRLGKLHGVITQNTDGLHGLSGLPPSAVVELHGNNHLLECIGCNRRYYYDHCVTSPRFHQRCTTTEIRQRQFEYVKKHHPTTMINGEDRLIDVDHKNSNPPTLEDFSSPDADDATESYDDASDHFNRKYSGHFCTNVTCLQPLVDVVVEFGEVRAGGNDTSPHTYTKGVTLLTHTHVTDSCMNVAPLIPFYQSLYDSDWKACQRIARAADLLIVLGSSLVVDPARSILNELGKRKCVHETFFDT